MKLLLAAAVGVCLFSFILAQDGTPSPGACDCCGCYDPTNICPEVLDLVWNQMNPTNSTYMTVDDWINLFRQADTDDDGNVDYTEFCVYWRNVTMSYDDDIRFSFCLLANSGAYQQCVSSGPATVLTEQAVRNSFAMIDLDGNGFVTRTEFENRFMVYLLLAPRGGCACPDGGSGCANCGSV
eukprot:GHVU01028243.1.p1 GENE.GHVU01028243.1~~GHVU01028243.1.p1  ORF type:complete len:182 (+),score=8.06 GHVU01028243.1:35-580(+)